MMSVGAIIPYAIMAIAGGITLWRDAPYPLAIPFLMFMASWYTVRLIITAGKEAPVAEDRAAGRERFLTTLVFLGMVVLPIAALVVPWLDIFAYPLVPPLVVLGAVVAVSGLWLFWRSHRDLDRNWSPHLELREEHALITSGIYARIRHPMYSAIFCMTIAQMLWLNNWVAGPAGFVAFTLLYVIRINTEEAMMADRFGADWAAYAARTPRLFPHLSRGKTP